MTFGQTCKYRGTVFFGQRVCRHPNRLVLFCQIAMCPKTPQQQENIMKTVTLTFNNNIRISFMADPENELLVVTLYDSSMAELILTTDIEDLRNLYDAIPSILTYYSSNFKRE